MTSSLFGSSSSSAPAPAAASNPLHQGSSTSLVPALTEDDVKRSLPANLRSSVTPSLVQTLNQLSSDPIIAENIRENFIGYTGVMKDGKFKIEDYLSAVTYVSYKLMNMSNQDAYIRTFPQRHQALVAKGASAKDIAAYVAAYHKGKLVNLIMEQTLVPSWVLNQDLYQKALNVQADLMLNAASEKVRTDAANSILTHLKRPEAVKGTLTLDVNESSGMKELKNMLTQLAANQQQQIQAGHMKTIDVASAKLIDHEGAEDVE